MKMQNSKIPQGAQGQYISVNVSVDSPLTNAKGLINLTVTIPLPNIKTSKQKIHSCNLGVAVASQVGSNILFDTLFRCGRKWRKTTIKLSDALLW